ncbi:hypothetical protein Zmor_008961 [Zophobas morio]|uniref:Uncharacterized protein n=1 Tax=Zophobas morio TaxID=2755281 RepID=A0AA38HID6_9CUCU|nr:hypothetical protein Zmor_008961 [Zophobas morio]
MVSVIGGGLLFAGLVMLEVVLMSSTAVQNFAEKTNLIAIHSDEKKFEKESRKSGKAMEYDPIVGMNPNGSIDSSAEIKYSEIPDQVTDPQSINNKKYRKYYIQ